MYDRPSPSLHLGQQTPEECEIRGICCFFGGRGWLSGVGHGLIYVFRKKIRFFHRSCNPMLSEAFLPADLSDQMQGKPEVQATLSVRSWFHLCKSWVSLHVKPPCIIFPNEWLLFPRRRCDSLLVALAKHTAHFTVSWYFMCYAMLLQCWYETIFLWTNIQLSLLSTIPLASIRSLCLQQALEIEDMFHSAGLSWSCFTENDDGCVT